MEAQHLLSYLTSAGVISIALTGALSAIGFYFKNRRESKKSSRRLLYLLLEIRHTISIATYNPEKDTDKYLDHYLEVLRKKGANVQRKNIEPYIRTVLESHFLNLALASKTDLNERLLTPFENALEDLSSTFPLLAFELRGKDKLETLISVTSSYTDSALDSLPLDPATPEWFKENLESSLKQQKEESFTEVTKKLDKDILILARHCGRSNYKLTKKHLSTNFSLLNDDIYSELEKSFNQLLSQMIAASKKNGRPKS